MTVNTLQRKQNIQLTYRTIYQDRTITITNIMYLENEQVNI